VSLLFLSRKDAKAQRIIIKNPGFFAAFREQYYKK
jgi:hypothetical protein